MNAVTLPIGVLMEIPAIPLEEPVLIIAVVMALVLVLPLLGRILRVPEIILLILAGMLFGENGLGLLARGQAIEVWGTVGLLYIMFLAGLEINVQDFLRNRYRSLLLGLLGFAVPQVAGTLAAFWMLGFGWTKAILLGSMLASFTLLTYPQVSRLGLNRKASVTVTVGGTLITDTLALLVLAVISELHGQDFSWGFVLRMTLAFLVFLAVVLAGVPLLGRWFFRRVGRDGGAQFLFVLLVAFLAGSLSRLAGIEPIIGAFLAGFTLNRLVPPQSALMNRVEFVGRNLFIPFFLISVGMIVDPRVFLADRATWLVGGVMVVAVFATKLAAALIAQRLLGYTRDEGWMIFGLTVPQAAATLAAVVVGCELGIFDEAVLNGTLMMILATCMVSPWITEYFGRRVALAMADGDDPGTAESGRLLVPVDNPATADRLMELGVLLRDRTSHEPLLPLRVVTTENEAGVDVAVNERMLFGAISVATSADIPVVPVIRVEAGVAEGVRRASVELRASTVLLGWSHHGAVGAAVFGGIMDDVLHTCQARVIACRLPVPLNTIRRVRLAVPPNAERESGFAETMQLVWRLTHQIGASLAVLCADANRERVMQAAARLKPEQKIEWPAAAGWSDVRRMLLAEGDADAGVLYIVLTAREGGVSWRPGLDRLPQALSSADDGTGSVMLVYPALPCDEGEKASLPALGTLPDLVSLGGVFRAEGSQTWEASLESLLRGPFGADTSVLASVCGVVRQAAVDFPIQLVDEVVLVHGHTQELAMPHLYVLVHPAGIALAETRSRVVLVLLGPEGGPPDRHLQVLSVLARLVRSETLVKALIEVQDETELSRILSDALAG